MTILGAAATPAMLLSPLLIRKLGKRNMYIFYILGNVITLVGMYLFVEQIWVLYACIWIRGFFNTFPLIADSAMSADVLDYQQYKSGDRLEGLMGQFVGTIGVFVSMGITYFTQTIVMQNHFGLVDNYDDLYKASFREPISKGMILIALVGFVLALIPFVTMYTLTEEEHESHIKVLKIRAALEDYATDSLSEGQLDEAKKIYADSVNEYNECIEALNSASNRKERKKLQSKIKALEIVIDEKDRFATEKMLKKTAKANELLTHTVEELYGISEPTLDKYNEANAMSENTKEEANLKATKLKEASKELDTFHKKAYDYIQARKLIKQKEYYANWDKIFVDEPELQEV